MMYPTRDFRLLATALLFGFAALLGGTAFGQVGIRTGKAPDPNLREVALVKQDFSDCDNSTPSALRATSAGQPGSCAERTEQPA